MPTPPDVVITRHPTGNVIAEGGDELATTLLKRAGFVIETTPRSFWYRLPWDMGEARENQMASHAARMLTAVGYRVELGPDLHAGPLTTPSDPRGTRVHGHQILRLTDELNSAETCATAASLTDHVLDPNDGVLVRLSEFFEAAAEQAKASETDAGWDLSYDFAEAAATLTSLGEDLHDAQLRALDRPAKPSWQARVASYYATAPAAQRPATAAVPPEAPAPAPPLASRPNRTR
ncbi:MULTISPECIES: hypothetical protein [unclassified Streptomyces]|uniref:hypothetical protein n=1 Tax=unclassified Streptomyces TaxID=2593676 RepID=UPI000DACF160|nr:MULTISPECIES: hypothetical protein [unclassified Streptomyces]PZT74122.1 hypothetical protein DNK55_18345 [Streptomyces sp. AC1-42T]PZT82889.1 hypothetical protein DNK56_13100 [Streptomyces sp. AC1-42W]